MKKEIGALAVALAMIVLFVVTPSVFADVYFYSDGVIEDGDVYSEDIGIYDTLPLHTTVDMTGGWVQKRIYTHDQSTLNISGGSVDGWVQSLGESTVNLSGGFVGEFITAESSIGNIILDGEARRIVSTASSEINIWAGIHLGLQVKDSSETNIFGGEISDITRVYDFSTINITGGILSTLEIHSTATANLYGGELEVLQVVDDDKADVVNIYGYGLAKIPYGGLNGDGIVTGFWTDGTPFLINLYNPNTYSHINLVPEPATLGLVLMGGLVGLLRKRRKV